MDYNTICLKYVELLDTEVDQSLDNDLRKLLSLCFDTEERIIFKNKRYNNELPYRRWLVYSEDELIAHACIHKKEITYDNRNVSVGGVAEVCVHPDFRKNGIIKELMKLVDMWLINHKYPFAILYGFDYIYKSSGYKLVDNLYGDSINGHEGEWIMLKLSLIKEMQENIQWPKTKVYISGKTF